MLNRAIQLLRHYRRWLIGGAIAVVLYAMAGFLLAPWLVKKSAVDAVRNIYGTELGIDDVTINPFTFSLRINGLAMDHPDGSPFARIEEVFVNFQASSLFRRAWTFREFHLDSPELFVARDVDGGLNLAFLTPSPGNREPQPDSAEGGDMPPLLIRDFAINEAALHWHDAVPPEPVETTFGPVDVAVTDLNTLLQRQGQQDVVITTESSGTFAWNGSLQLNPLRSSGRASIKGPHFQLLSDYIRHQVGFDIDEGHVDVELDYTIETAAGSLSAGIENLELALTDVTVRTFSGDATQEERRPILQLPSLNVSGGSLQWPERRVSLASITISDTAMNLYRDTSGRLDVLPRGGDGKQTDVAAEVQTAEPPGPKPWQATLDRLEISRLSVGLIDDSVQPRADIGTENLNLVISEISNAADASFPTALDLQMRSGGEIRAEGTIAVLPALEFDLGLEIAEVNFAGLHPYIQQFADVNLDSGNLGFSGRLAGNREQPLRLEGDLAVRDFRITETDQGSRLGSWQVLLINGIALDLEKQALGISDIRFEKPYADVFIAEDGSVNLGRVEKGEQSAAIASGEDPPHAAETAPGAEEAGGKEAPLTVTIGRVVITDGSADFADLSLPLPFAAKLAELNGALSAVATTSRKPSTVSLEGKVDDFGLVTIAGTVTPLQPARNTDITVGFRNVTIPKFSAYTIAFAGREIASGKLDLDLGYRVQGSEFVGENRIVLREFELGDRVDHPGAMSLPLGLAVALLKDPSGKIDIDLPVRGNLDDPEFRYGRVVLGALGNLIVKIVASPFALLGKLVGVEPSELEHIGFLPGRADLTPPELERAAKLAEALALRPELVLEITGVFDRVTDAEALRLARLNDSIEERIAAAGDDDYAEQRHEVLEALYRERVADEDSRGALEALREEHTSDVVDKESGRSSEQFDELAYLAAVEQRLAELIEVTDEELSLLAMRRAENTSIAILDVDPELAERLKVADVYRQAGAENERVPMDVTLGTAGAAGGPD